MRVRCDRMEAGFNIALYGALLFFKDGGRRQNCARAGARAHVFAWARAKFCVLRAGIFFALSPCPGARVMVKVSVCQQNRIKKQKCKNQKCRKEKEKGKTEKPKIDRMTD